MTERRGRGRGRNVERRDAHPTGAHVATADTPYISSISCIRAVTAQEHGRGHLLKLKT